MQGMMDGRMFAEDYSNRRKLLLIGLLTFPFGGWIGYFGIGSDPLTAEANMALLAPNSSPAYSMAFIQAYNEKSRSKKRKSFLTGCGLSMAGFVLLIGVSLMASGENN